MKYAFWILLLIQIALCGATSIRDSRATKFDTDPPPIPSGVIQIPPSSSQLYSWDVRLHAHEKHQFLELETAISGPKNVEDDWQLNVTLTNLRPDLSLIPIPLEAYWSDPKRNSFASIQKCHLNRGKSSCLIRKACELPANESRWFVLVESAGDPNAITSFTLSPRIRHVYLHKMTFGQPLTIIHNPTSNTSHDYAIDFDFFSFQIPMPWFAQMPFGTYLRLELDIVSPTNAELDATINRDSLPSPPSRIVKPWHDDLASDSCHLVSCVASVNGSCSRLVVKHGALSDYGVWYFAVKPQATDPNTIITYTARIISVEPSVSNLSVNSNDMVTLSDMDSMKFFKLIGEFNPNVLSTLSLSVSDVVGGEIELALAHNKLPLWHAEPGSLVTNGTSFCMTNFSCSLYVGVCDFQSSGVYVAAVRPIGFFHPGTPISFTIAARVFSSYVGETQLTPNADYPHVTYPGALRLFDVNMRGVDTGDDLHLEVYSASPHEKLRLSVLRYPSQTCFEEILSCETTQNSDSQSSSCLVEIPECLLREQRQLNNDLVRLAVRWNPDHPAGPLEYTIKVKSATIQKISDSFLHRNRLVGGQSTQYMVSPHALQPNMAIEITVSCLTGKLTLFENFREKAGDIPGCVSFHSKYELDSQNGNVSKSLVLRNCPKLDPSPTTGIFFSVRSDSGISDFTFVSKMIQQENITSQEIFSEERAHGILAPGEKKLFYLTNLGMINAGDRGLWFTVKSSALRPGLRFRVANTRDRMCVDRSIQTHSCPFVNGSCTMFIPPCFIHTADWMGVMHNEGNTTLHYDLEFLILPQTSISLRSAEAYAGVAKPFAPVQFEYDVGQFAYLESPTFLLITLYSTSATSSEPELGLYGLAPNTAKKSLAGPFACYAHDTSCTAKGGCTLLVNSFELQQGKYRFAVMSHSKSIDTSFTIKVSQLPASYSLSRTFPRHGAVLAGETLFYRIELDKSLLDPNATSSKSFRFSILTSTRLCHGKSLHFALNLFLFPAISSALSESHVRLSLLSSLPTPSGVWGAGYRCVDCIHSCSVHSSQCSFTVDYCQLNPQKYWVMVEGVHPTEFTVSYGADRPSLPLLQLPLAPCSQPAQPQIFSLFDEQYQHLKVDLSSLTPNDTLLSLRLSNFSNGEVSIFESAVGNLATKGCSSEMQLCGANKSRVVEFSCLEHLKYLSLRGKTPQGPAVSFQLLACFEIVPNIQLSLASPRSQIRAHRQSAASIALNLANVSNPQVAVAVDDVRGGFTAALQLSLCEGSNVLAQCKADKNGGCLLEISRCDLSLLGNSTNFTLYVVVNSEHSQGELIITAELKSLLSNIHPLQLGAVQTISLGPYETQPFTLSIPSYTPPVNDNFESYRLDVFVHSDDPEAIEASLTLSPNAPVFPSHDTCQTQSPWYQLHCNATSADHQRRVCMTVQACSLVQGMDYILLLRNTQWKFRATPPIIPVAVTVQVNLVVDAQFSVLHVDAPETSRQASMDYKNEIYASFSGLSRTQSIVVQHKSDDLFDLYFSRINPAGSDSECYSKFDSCEATSFCERQYFGCGESYGLPSTLYFDVEPVFDRATISSRAYVQTPAPIILNTPVTSQSVGKYVYRHYTFELPSGLSVSYTLEIDITLDQGSSGYVHGYLTRHGQSQLAGDESDASCLSHLRACQSDMTGVCRIRAAACGESGTFSLGVKGIMGHAAYSMEVRLLRHNSSTIQEGHTVAHISSEDGAVVRQIYSHHWGDSDPLNYIVAQFSGVTGRIIVRWAVGHSCKHRGLCVAQSSQPCEIYIPPGDVAAGNYMFIVDTLDKDVRFHIDLKRSRAPQNPFSDPTNPIQVNMLYRYNLVLDEPVIVYANLSPQNVSQSTISFLIEYVAGGEIEAWVTRGNLGLSSKRRLLCRSEHQSLKKCRLELPRCPSHNQQLSGPWNVELRATKQPHASFNVPVQVGFAIFAKPDPTQRVQLVQGAATEIMAAKSLQWPTEGEIIPQRLLFVYDIVGAPEPLIDSWELQFRISPEAVQEATLMISFDEPGDVCPTPLHGTCIADISSNNSCSLSISSCKMQGHFRVYAWIADWVLKEPLPSDIGDHFVDFLGTVKLKSTVDRAIPILSEKTKDRKEWTQRGFLLPGASRFYILDLSLISESYRLSLLFRHDAKCSDMRLSSSWESPPDDPSRGCGNVVCTCSGCMAYLEGCSAALVPTGKIIIGIQADSQSPRTDGIDFSLHFAFKQDAATVKNFECVSAVGPKWFKHFSPLQGDELLSVQIAPNRQWSSVSLVNNITSTEEPDAVNLMTGEPLLGHRSHAEESISLFLSPRYAASRMCHDAFCDSKKESGCTLLWRCDSPTDNGANVSIGVIPYAFNIPTSYTLFQTPIRVRATLLSQQMSRQIEILEHTTPYRGAYGRFDVRNENSLLLIRVEARHPLFNFYTKHRVNYGCGDETCVVLSMNETLRSCWMLLGGLNENMKGAHYVQMVPFLPEHKNISAVVNATEISAAPDPILPLMQLREYQVSIGDFISFELESSISNFSASLLPANFSISIYGMNSSYYKVWLTIGGPGSPRLKVQSFEENHDHDMTSLAADYSSVMGKKLFLNILFITTEEYDVESVFSVALRTAVVPHYLPPMNHPLEQPAILKEGSVFRVDLIPGYPTKLVWTPSKASLDKHEILSVEVFNVTGSGFFTGRIFPASQVDHSASIPLMFTSTQFWSHCSLGSKLSSSYLIELTTELIMEATSFELHLDLKSSNELRGSQTTKDVNESTQHSTHLFALNLQSDKASAFQVRIGQGNDVLVRFYPFDSEGCFVEESSPSSFSTFTCASEQTCLYSSRSIADRWQQSHLGVTGYYAIVSTFGSTYSVNWRSGSGVCTSPKASAVGFCAAKQNLGSGFNLPAHASDDNTVLHSLDAGAQGLYAKMRDHMRCDSGTGICRDLSKSCTDQLESLACHLTFPNCDKDGFSRPVCSDACLAAEIACNATFAAVGLPQLDCTRSSTFARRTNICAEESIECFGCDFQSHCSKIMEKQEGISCDNQRLRNRRHGYIWVLWLVFGVAITFMLLALIFSVAKAASKFRRQAPFSASEEDSGGGIKAPPAASTPLLSERRRPISSSSYESLPVDEPVVEVHESSAPSAPPHEPHPPRQRDSRQ